MIEYKTYDWNHLIKDSDRHDMIKDIRDVIDQGRYWTNCPRYQTTDNIFGLNADYWVNIKMSFIWSCFAYLKRDVQIKSVKSWSYMTSLKYTEEDRDTLWHTHTREGSKVVSGVYYLHVPQDVDTVTAGTEFSPLGPEQEEGRFFAEAQQGHWAIWPGSAWHRPGVLQSEEDRFIIAADMEF
jgi:hypothetical protein